MPVLRPKKTPNPESCWRQAVAHAQAARFCRQRVLMLTAVLVLIPTPVAASDSRLFTTPEQRERLDRKRAEMTAEELARDPEPEEETQPVTQNDPPPQVHLRGFVRRSDGPAAAWVNDGSTIKGLGEGLTINTDRIGRDSAIVRLPDGKHVRLKPGQTWNPGSGRVSDYVSADPTALPTAQEPVPAPEKVSEASGTTGGDQAYKDFVRALEAYTNTDGSADAEAFRRRGQLYGVLESTARVLARRDKTESQRDALLNRLERAREAYGGTTIDSTSNFQVAAQRRKAMEAIELALGLR